MLHAINFSNLVFLSTLAFKYSNASNSHSSMPGSRDRL